MRRTVGILVAASLLVGSTHAQESTSHERVQLDATCSTFVAISVPDIEGSAAWYSRFFSLEETFAYASESGDLRIVVLSAPGLRVELQQHATAEPAVYLDGKRYLKQESSKSGSSFEICPGRWRS